MSAGVREKHPDHTALGSRSLAGASLASAGVHLERKSMDVGIAVLDSWLRHDLAL